MHQGPGTHANADCSAQLGDEAAGLQPSKQASKAVSLYTEEGLPDGRGAPGLLVSFIITSPAQAAEGKTWQATKGCSCSSHQREAGC